MIKGQVLVNYERKPAMPDYGIPYQTTESLRKSFLSFFEEREHLVLKSAPLLPQDDPTLLFTNAGMNQFKSIFLGENPQGWRRVANSQKCLRVSGKHNDLDEVGRDGSHHTFFEMLGNWSFADYGSAEAIAWAWELLTKVWGFPKERLFVSVYFNDDATTKIWQEQGVPADRILRFKEDNFWEMGAVGPCGPCSEIHFDTGPLDSQEEVFRDPEKGVNGSDGRFLEIWNLVFIKYERLADGSLRDLGQEFVDTGCGLERVASLAQGKDSNYDGDLFQGLIQEIAKSSGRAYSRGPDGLAHRVLADHLRALSFCIADGVSPGNEGRGYVLRRILRRASRYAHSLGKEEPFLCTLVSPLVKLMGGDYPELVAKEDHITKLIESEERRFLRTLKQGLLKLERLIEEKKQAGEKLIQGEEAFLYHDTYGFPVDLTAMIAGEAGLEIDDDGYRQCMEAQQNRGRQHARFQSNLASEESWEVLSDDFVTEFRGYETLNCESSTLRYSEDGDEIFVVLAQTPFYAEAGGQCGDQGFLFNDHIRLRVLDTFKLWNKHVHKCSLVSGLLSRENMTKLVAEVDPDLRVATRRAHSATHLLQAALKEILGEHIEQQGSYVGPDYVRFDFRHHQAVTKDEVDRVEARVNSVVRDNLGVSTEIMSLEAAKAKGAVALFGEQYGDEVRVLQIGDFSLELCGGTHAGSSGDIGVFIIQQESSIAAGIRRIEARTGAKALDIVKQERELLRSAAKSLKAKPLDVEVKIVDLQKRLKETQEELVGYRQRSLQQSVSSILDRLRQGPQSVLLLGSLDFEFDISQAKVLLQAMQDGIKDEVVVLAYGEGTKLHIFCAVGKGLQKSLPGGKLVQDLCKEFAGKGGGRPAYARGVCPQVAESKVFAWVREYVSGQGVN